MTARTTAPAHPAAPHHAGAHVSTLTPVAARLPLTSAALAARRTAAGPAPALARTLLDWHSDDVDECGPEAVAAILSAPAVPTGLRIVHGIHWPPHPGAVAPPLAGFTVSSFNPLVAAAAEQCLGQRPAHPQPRRTALLLASHTGDRATGAAIRDAVGSGRTVPPLLFFQSNPNAVLGHVAARWQLTGPVVAISRPARIIGLTHEVLAEASVLLHDGDADEVLVIVAEQGRTPAEPDEAVAALVALRG
ncbi:MAG TPA: beta-ketoacyl synthase chain length factor [Actinocrinis sp.]|nr:beta-ketoacyl synthase chain length factor [Actinocrinis sp.]